ncbi:hypothetical protein ADICEAN_01717 [Cesiribacter andamanensis AMV16]|uniref:Uncharacterized protein n=1 Tax=Cesiribacter andamanensis AMV16 TaxID=1279009 RepID=M7N798_9BACT|nr:hypothetical protein ADICEAN_01717 [Cesiribacter andamanensis AMV16]
MQHPLHNDYRPVDHNAKIQRPQRHQVGRYPKQVHHDKGKEQRQGNDRGHNKTGPQVAQQQYQHKDYNKPPFQQVGFDGTGGAAHQLGAVQVGDNLKTIGQRGLYLGYALVYPLQGFGRVGPL